MRPADRVGTTTAVVAWYLAHYHRTPADLGGSQMYCDRERMGHFAATPQEFEAGAPRAMLRMLVATTLFQRRQDQQVFRILRALDAEQVKAMTVLRRLRAGIARCACPLVKGSAHLHARCDVAKLPGAARGTCQTAPKVLCPPKVHTVWLRRYADFGKVPSSAALMLEDENVRDLGHLRRAVLRRWRTPDERAEQLQVALMRVWRVSSKMAAMFLSAVSNPDLSTLAPPWFEGIAWARYVVIDSNVERFLAAVGHRTLRSYDARYEAVCALAREVRLDALNGALTRYNPRLVQQAMYIFMSRSNRMANPADCVHDGDACRRCDKHLVRICPVVRG